MPNYLITTEVARASQRYTDDVGMLPAKKGQQQEQQQQQQQEQPKQKRKPRKEHYIEKHKEFQEVTIINEYMTTDEMGHVVPPPPYLPRKSCGVSMSTAHWYPNYIDQAHLVSDCGSDPWDLVLNLTPVERAMHLAYQASGTISRLRHTGEEDGLFVELTEWSEVSWNESGEDLLLQDVIENPDEDGYVLL